MGIGVAQDEAQLRPRTPFSRPRTFKNEGQKTNPKKDTKNYDEGAKMEPKMGTRKRKKKIQNQTPTYSASASAPPGSQGSGPGRGRRKCRRSRSLRGGLSYVAENEERYERSGG